MTLAERAQREAEKLGHELGPFSKVERRPIWHTHCKRCGLEAAVTVDPQPGEPTVYGGAVTAVCADRGQVASVTEKPAG